MKRAMLIGLAAALVVMHGTGRRWQIRRPTEDFEGFDGPRPADRCQRRSATAGRIQDAGPVRRRYRGERHRRQLAPHLERRHGLRRSVTGCSRSGSTDAATEDGRPGVRGGVRHQVDEPALQPGLQVSVAPQSAGGARMSFLKFEDTRRWHRRLLRRCHEPGRRRRRPSELVQIANNLDSDRAHHVKIVLDLYKGPHNDVAQVFIDGSDRPLVPVGGRRLVRRLLRAGGPPGHVNKAKAGRRSR